MGFKMKLPIRDPQVWSEDTEAGLHRQRSSDKSFDNPRKWIEALTSVEWKHLTFTSLPNPDARSRPFREEEVFGWDDFPQLDRPWTAICNPYN